MLIPVECPVCGARGRAPCLACAALLRRAPSVPAPAGVDRCRALLDYEGAGRELVARLKYRNARSSVPFLARGMAGLVEGPVEVVTWAPTAPARMRARGFDQAEVLARAVARRIGVRARPLLRRAPGPPQTGRDAAGRRAGPVFSPRRRVPAAAVLLVDDVVTTGATAAAAAVALRQGGARRVEVVAAARTAPHRRHVQSAMAEARRAQWK